jgi:glycosyltransferase involved in cell wall biosynthesis
MPEVCGNAAIYAAPDDPEAWVRAIEQVLGNSAVRQALASAGHERSRLFSWREGAVKYLAAVAEIDQLGLLRPN